MKHCLFIDASAHPSSFPAGNKGHLIHCRLCTLAFFLGQQFPQHLFGTDVPPFNTIQVVLRLDAGSDGEKAVEASSVVAAVFVLGAAIHRGAKLPENA